ncbi:hypothetical protein ACHAW6_011552 [Cyclotella cf. meneghiniana]
MSTCNRFVTGDNKINYLGEGANPTAEILVAKILFSSIISTPGACFMTMDISKFYIMNPLKLLKYIHTKLSDLPDKAINECNLHATASCNGMMFVKVIRGMYGLPEAGLLAQELLKKCLNKHGYFQRKLIPSLWKHEIQFIQFELTFDDFGIKYVNKEYTNHLKSVLKQHYKISTVGLATVTSVSTCTGTISPTKSIFTCPTTSKRLSSDSNTNAPRNKTNLSLTLPSNMVQKTICQTTTNLIPHPSLTQKQEINTESL